ncbi:UNVERIFIED_CONTAM: hypothetical protein FKN15_004467 [Acipenser sinensis]
MANLPPSEKLTGLSTSGQAKDKNLSKSSLLKVPKGVSSSRFLPKGTKTTVNLEEQGRQKVSFSFSLPRKNLQSRFLPPISPEKLESDSQIVAVPTTSAPPQDKTGQLPDSQSEPFEPPPVEEQLSPPKLKLDMGKMHFEKHLLSVTSKLETAPPTFHTVLEEPSQPEPEPISVSEPQNDMQNSASEEPMMEDGPEDPSPCKEKAADTSHVGKGDGQSNVTNVPTQYSGTPETKKQLSQSECAHLGSESDGDSVKTSSSHKSGDPKNAVCAEKSKDVKRNLTASKAEESGKSSLSSSRTKSEKDDRLSSHSKSDRDSRHTFSRSSRSESYRRRSRSRSRSRGSRTSSSYSRSDRSSRTDRSSRNDRLHYTDSDRKYHRSSPHRERSRSSRPQSDRRSKDSSDSEDDHKRTHSKASDSRRVSTRSSLHRESKTSSSSSHSKSEKDSKREPSHSSESEKRTRSHSKSERDSRKSGDSETFRRKSPDIELDRRRSSTHSKSDSIVNSCSKLSTPPKASEKKFRRTTSSSDSEEELKGRSRSQVFEKSSSASRSDELRIATSRKTNKKTDNDEPKCSPSKPKESSGSQKSDRVMGTLTHETERQSQRKPNSKCSESKAIPKDPCSKSGSVDRKTLCLVNNNLKDSSRKEFDEMDCHLCNQPATPNLNDIENITVPEPDRIQAPVILEYYKTQLCNWTRSSNTEKNTTYKNCSSVSKLQESDPLTDHIKSQLLTSAICQYSPVSADIKTVSAYCDSDMVVDEIDNRLPETLSDRQQEGSNCTENYKIQSIYVSSDPHMDIDSIQYTCSSVPSEKTAATEIVCKMQMSPTVTHTEPKAVMLESATGESMKFKGDSIKWKEAADLCLASSIKEQLGENKDSIEKKLTSMEHSSSEVEHPVLNKGKSTAEGSQKVLDLYIDKLPAEQQANLEKYEIIPTLQPTCTRKELLLKEEKDSHQEHKIKEPNSNTVELSLKENPMSFREERPLKKDPSSNSEISLKGEQTFYFKEHSITNADTVAPKEPSSNRDHFRIESNLDVVEQALKEDVGLDRDNTSKLPNTGTECCLYEEPSSYFLKESVQLFLKGEPNSNPVGCSVKEQPISSGEFCLEKQPASNGEESFARTEKVTNQVDSSVWQPEELSVRYVKPELQPPSEARHNNTEEQFYVASKFVGDVKESCCTSGGTGKDDGSWQSKPDSSCVSSKVSGEDHMGGRVDNNKEEEDQDSEESETDDSDSDSDDSGIPRNRLQSVVIVPKNSSHTQDIRGLLTPFSSRSTTPEQRSTDCAQPGARNVCGHTSSDEENTRDKSRKRGRSPEGRLQAPSPRPAESGRPTFTSAAERFPDAGLPQSTAYQSQSNMVDSTSHSAGIPCPEPRLEHEELRAQEKTKQTLALMYIHTEPSRFSSWEALLSGGHRYYEKPESRQGKGWSSRQPYYQSGDFSKVDGFHSSGDGYTLGWDFSQPEMPSSTYQQPDSSYGVYPGYTHHQLQQQQQQQQLHLQGNCTAGQLYRQGNTFWAPRSEGYGTGCASGPSQYQEPGSQVHPDSLTDDYEDEERSSQLASASSTGDPHQQKAQAAPSFVQANEISSYSKGAICSAPDRERSRKEESHKPSKGKGPLKKRRPELESDSENEADPGPPKKDHVDEGKVLAVPSPCQSENDHPRCSLQDLQDQQAWKEGSKTGKMPPYFNLIEENLYLTERKKSKSHRDIKRMQCECSLLTKEERAQGRGACGEDCLNRLLMIECSSRCPNGPYCSNRRFQRKQHADFEVILTESKGWGLRAAKDLAHNTFVLEYCGEVLDHKEFKARVKEYARSKNIHYYFMALKNNEGVGFNSITGELVPDCRFIPAVIIAINIREQLETVAVQICSSRCPNGPYCSNRRFQRKQHADFEVILTESKGWGLRAAKDLAHNTFVLEYCGEVLDHKEFKARVKEYARSKNIHYYFMALKNNEIIDATQKGNCSRFMNHSCEPNCETQKWTVNGQLRVGFFTTKLVPAGTELTFDYQFQRYGKEAQKCFCGAPSCRGFLGGENRVSVRAAGGKMKKERPRKKDSVDEELEALLENGDGLSDEKQVLSLCRLMVRVETMEQKLTCLKLIQVSWPALQ